MKKILPLSSYRSAQMFTFVSIFALFLTSALGMNQFIFLKSDCSEGGYVSKSDYQSNVQNVLANLTVKSSTTTFSNFTSGGTSNKVYGLFLCDSLQINQNCHDCVTAAAASVRQSCPSSAEATVWYSSCMLRYSNRDIFSNDDVSVYYNILNGPTKFSQYDQRLSDAFISLINEATTQNSSSTSALISVYVTSDIIAACYVDCTPDIGHSECNQCLQTAVGRLQFDGSQQGLVLQPSCRLSYFFSDSAPDSQGKMHYVAVGVIAAVAVASVVMNVCAFLERRKTNASPTGLDELESMEHLRFNFAAIRDATGNFSAANKLGQGGFGVVYLGTLPDGKTVAVKRLSNASTQGIKEFTSEACLTARLQHRNLVKLFGFCLEKQEMLLVYEFLANKSLDRFLFDSDRGAYLKWKTRYKIILGLTRGLSYLHEDSEPKIIHRDLKPSNILLDEEMNPRVADFGIAKPFEADQTQGDTTRVAGTFGYMAPEYVLTGRICVKADIFSYGVIVLEIVSGLRNNCPYPDFQADNLLSYVWRLWREGNPLKLVDSAVQSDFSVGEVERCIYIGLLCVQENPAKRPDISSVLQMLNT